MRRIRVYVDTSVFGGVQDAPFTESSRHFFRRVHNREFVILLSKLTIEELQPAPESVRQVLQGLPVDCVEQIVSDEEVLALAEAYLEAGALGKASTADAHHVANATVARADLVLSWNFKHIVNFERIRIFNGVNVLKGYSAIEIRSPLELGHGNEADDI